MGQAIPGAQALTAIIGSVGDVLGGQSQASAAKYNAAVAQMNKKAALTNAAMVGEAGSEQAAIQSQKTRGEVGAIKTNQAAGGVSVDSGSAVDTRVSAEELGKLDALTIRSNAAKEAYGYQTQAANFEAESELDKAEASHDLEAGWIKGAGTLIGGGADAGSSWEKLQMAGAIGG